MMKTTSVLSCLLTCLFLITSCIPGTPHATVQPTTLTTLTRTPTPTIVVTSTPTPLPSPTLLPQPTMLPARFSDQTYLNVKSICLDVATTGFNESKSIVDAVQQTLERAGFEILTTKGNCDASMEIKITFTPLAGKYVSSVDSSEQCYVTMGATILGEIKFSAPEQDELIFPINHSKPLPSTISSCEENPNLGPVQWGSDLANVMAEIWGPSVLVYALGVDSINDYAVQILETNKFDARSAESLVPALIRALNNQNSLTRRDAVKVLRSYTTDASSAIPYLIPLLSDSDVEIRTETAATLGEFGSLAAPAVPVLLVIMNEGDTASEAAIRALGKIGPAAAPAIPALIAIMQKEGIGVSVDVIEAIGGIGPTAADAAPYLFAIFESDNLIGSESFSENQVAAAISLAKLGVDMRPVLEKIALLADSQDSDTALAGARVLNGMASSAPEVMPYLIHIIEPGDYHDYYAKMETVLNLGSLGEAAKEAIPVLHQLADPNSTDLSLRCWALVSLVKLNEISNTEAANQLVAILQTEEGSSRDEAAYALGSLGEEVADISVPVLMKLLQNSPDGSDMAQYGAVRALGNIGERAAIAIPLLISIIPEETKIGIDAVNALGKIGPASMNAVPVIIDKMREEDNKYAMDTEVQALKDITGQDFGENISLWDEWWKINE